MDEGKQIKLKPSVLAGVERPRREKEIGWCARAVGIGCEDEFVQLFFAQVIDLKFLNFAFKMLILSDKKSVDNF